MKVWIVGQILEEWKREGSAWAFQGVFSTKKKAIKACKYSSYFIFSAKLDEELTKESYVAKDAEYPNQ